MHNMKGGCLTSVKILKSNMGRNSKTSCVTKGRSQAVYTLRSRRRVLPVVSAGRVCVRRGGVLSGGPAVPIRGEVSVGWGASCPAHAACTHPLSLPAVLGGSNTDDPVTINYFRAADPL